MFGVKQNFQKCFLAAIIILALITLQHFMAGLVAFFTDQQHSVIASPGTWLHRLHGYWLDNKEASTSKVGQYDTWQIANFRVGKLGVYSAYFDTRHPQNYVRIVAMVREDVRNEPIYCDVQYHNTTVQTKGLFPDSYGVKGPSYRGGFLLCPVNITQPPITVTLRQNPGIDLGTELRVQHMTPGTPLLGRFAACVRPFFHNYNQVNLLIEWIELHRILGVEHIIFYNFSTGSDVEKVINYYSKQGIVTLLQWNIPFIVTANTHKNAPPIHAHGQTASLQDCYLRTMYRYEWLAIVDVDEIILPRSVFNYSELVDLVEGEEGASSANYGVYSARNGFFFLDEKDDKEIVRKDNDVYLVTALKTWRVREINQSLDRCKILIRPEAMEYVGAHLVHEIFPGYGTKLLPTDVALLHHYRHRDGMKEITDLVVDRSAHRYAPQLSVRVKHVCAAVFGDLCPSPKIKTPH